MKKFLIVLLCLILFIVGSCKYIGYTWKMEEEEYYSEKEVFVECRGTVTYINYKDDIIYLVFDFDMSENGFSDYSFKLNEANSRIVIKSGFLGDIRKGDTLNFISAPRYFGDGYTYPIVGLSSEVKIYLDFETGYNYFMQDYE